MGEIFSLLRGTDRRKRRRGTALSIRRESIRRDAKLNLTADRTVRLADRTVRQPT